MDALTVIAENLTDADRLLADSWKLRRSHLADLADHLDKRLESGEEAEQMLTSLYSEFGERLAEQGPVSQDGELSAALSLFTRLELCRALAKKRPVHRIALYENTRSVIAYFQNPYAGRILQSVTELLGGGEAIAAEDYIDACEGVADGRYDFCVLPVESAGDGVMNRFVQLIDRYDLFTVLTCRLELSEEEYIRFALLSATPCSLTGADHLQLKLVTGEEQLWELLLAVRSFGAELAGCRLIPTDGEESYQLTLLVSDADMAAIHYYLSMGWSRSNVIGYYKQIDLSAKAEQELLY